MGANNSLPDDDPRVNLKHKDQYTTSAKHRLSYHGIVSAKGKPSPPEGTPSLKNITHNSLTVVWSPPQGQRVDEILAYRVELYNVSLKRWKVITNCCQGTSYDVKDLKPDSEYCLRIRAENVFGWSKPSQSTHVIRTRPTPNRHSMFEMEEAKQSKLVRRHSYHIKIEPKVATMLLNKTEETGEYNSIGTFPMRRNSSIRLSLPIQRRTVTNLFSDSRRESVSSIRDTRRRSVEESSVCTDETDESMKSVKLHQVSMSTEDESCARSTSSTSMSSIPEMNEDDTETYEHTHQDFKKNNYWKDTWISPTPEVSHNDILTSPYSDDTKLSMFSRSPTQNHSNNIYDLRTTNESNPRNHEQDLSTWKGSEDFKLDNLSDLSSLTDILYSSDFMGKSFISDNNGNYSCGKLYDSVIQEVDEDRITTL